MANDRPHSLPIGCSRFTISDSGSSNFDSPSNNVQRRSRFSNLFRASRRSRPVYRHRSGSYPPFSHVSENITNDGRNTKSFTDSTMVMACDSSEVSSTVDISDLQFSDNSHVTMAMLRKCNRQVIRPFRFVLVLVAWRPVVNTSYVRHPILCNIINIFCSFLIISLLFVSYIYQVFLCRWGLDISPATNSSSGHHHPHHYEQQDQNSSELSRDVRMVGSHCGFLPRTNATYIHLVTVYLIPNFLHFIAYLIGFVHFRISASEHVYALMEKVFLSYPGRDNSKDNRRRLVVKLRIFIVCCFVWTALSVASNFLYDRAFVFSKRQTFLYCDSDSCTYILWIAEILGNVVTYVVSIVITFNFTVQCEAIIAYINCLLQRIQERSMEMREVIKEINSIKQHIKTLNGAPSVMMGIMIFILGELCVMGILILLRLEAPGKSELAYRILFILRTLPVSVLPIFQVSRVNRHCNRIRHAGIEVRTNGYRNASQLELDSFLLYTTKNRFWVKLFSIAIRGYHITLMVIIGLITLGILVRTNIIKLRLM